MTRILVTNDDGVHSEGIRVLAAALAPLGQVTIVAPHQEASAIGHALTLRRPLRIETHGTGIYAVDGTPTDCVNLGVDVIMRDHPPALVVSGINKGWNLGDDVTYSGTVSGALEGILLGVPSIAVSLKREAVFDFTEAARAAAAVAESVLRQGLPPRTLLNLNVPTGVPKGLRATVQAKRNHVTKIDSRTDPRGGLYYWIEEGLNDWEINGGKSDYEAVMAGYVSVTPIQPDMTAYDALMIVETLAAELRTTAD
ncbi:MAG: 5'/3'-nucleotidase SurE [Vicinamibacterales bacterium]|nr:5'/3'-nucleotidase SurE [Vicinamibacterales bacterium]